LKRPSATPWIVLLQFEADVVAFLPVRRSACLQNLAAKYLVAAIALRNLRFLVEHLHFDGLVEKSLRFSEDGIDQALRNAVADAVEEAFVEARGPESGADRFALYRI